AQHAPGAAEDVAEALVVRHPLQPFSTAAFGAGGDPRRFSYAARWREAAAGAGRRRVPLPPWFEGEPLPAPDAEPDLPLSALRRFLLRPAEELLRRMDVRLVGIEERGEDLEPLDAPAGGLERSRLQHALFEALLQGHDDARIHARLGARGLLPSAAPGRRVLAEARRTLAPWVEAFGAWRGDAQPRAVSDEAYIDGVRVHGRIEDVYPGGIARLRFGERTGPARVRHGLDGLLGGASGVDLRLAEFHDAASDGDVPHGSPGPSPQAARAALHRLLEQRAIGLRDPLPDARYSVW